MITYNELENGLTKLNQMADEALKQRIASHGGSANLSVNNGISISLHYDVRHGYIVAHNDDYDTSEVVQRIEDKLMFIKLLGG